VDKALTNCPFLRSRSRVAKLIQAGLITLDGNPVKPSHSTQTGQIFKIQIPEEKDYELRPLDKPLHILYEDKDVVVLQKPAGLVVHPSLGHADDTLVNALIHQVKDLSMGFAENRPGIIHRLDKDTSGLLVVAKNDLSHQQIALQFKNRTVGRNYWALVYGKFNPQQCRIESLLARHPKDRKRFASQTRGAGKRAITLVSCLGQSKGLSLLKIRLETGRTHQIRVHLSEKGYPIVGDLLYGRKRRVLSLASKSNQDLVKALKRFALHAYHISFLHPGKNQRMKFSWLCPNDLKGIVKAFNFDISIFENE